LRERIVDAWSGDSAALAEIIQAADANVFDPWLLAWAGRVAAHAGDDDVAERYSRLIDIGLRGAPQGVEIDVGARVPARDAALGTNSFNYGNYMHRRTSPFDAIVPGYPAPVIVERHAARDPVPEGGPGDVADAG
jgi:hypothetical protein